MLTQEKKENVHIYKAQTQEHLDALLKKRLKVTISYQNTDLLIIASLDIFIILGYF